MIEETGSILTFIFAKQAIVVEPGVVRVIVAAAMIVIMMTAITTGIMTAITAVMIQTDLPETVEK